MRLWFVWVDRTRDAHIGALVSEYQKRLKRFTRCDVVELERSLSRDRQAVLEEEGARIRAALTPGQTTVLLDREGNEWSSVEVAGKIERWQNDGTKEIAFIIGGHYGVSLEVRERAQLRWSLSRLTLTHEMARLVLLEQVYRAYTIIHGLPYHK